MLSDRVRADLGSALKAKDAVRAGALRMLLSQFKNAEIEKRGPLAEADELAQVTKAVKVRREAIEGAVKAGRDDIKAKEEAELKVLEAYLPARMSGAELEALVAAAIAAAGAAGPADMGKVMKALAPQVAGKADNAEVAQLVRAKLAARG